MESTGKVETGNIVRLRVEVALVALNSAREPEPNARLLFNACAGFGRQNAAYMWRSLGRSVACDR
jgi:hypothetical protein